MKTHKEMIAEWRRDPEFRAEYNALAEEIAVFDALVEARKAAGLTQAEVAKRMGTKTPAIARLESSGGARKPSPSLNTLRRYADAVGCELEIKLVRRD
ncbi:MAG: helix-turn-helix transcriptional regulator [Syntrophobacteraceae bacterium]